MKVVEVLEKGCTGFQMRSKDFNLPHNGEELAKSKGLHINYLNILF